MKSIIIILTSIFGLMLMSFTPKNEDMKNPNESIYEVTLNSLEGNSLSLKSLKGKKILFVNVASKCGYTSQYEDLQKLHVKYGHKVTVIGLPCNQFGSQEPGTSKEISVFCKKNYGVSFQMTEKINVKGANQHELYRWLTKKNFERKRRL